MRSSPSGRVLLRDVAMPLCTVDAGSYKRELLQPLDVGAFDSLRRCACNTELDTAALLSLLVGIHSFNFLWQVGHRGAVHSTPRKLVILCTTNLLQELKGCRGQQS